MPALTNVVFALSFVATFSLLLAVTSFIKSRLHAAGYYVGDIILLGLPKNVTDRDQTADTTASSSMVDFSSLSVQVAALAFALVTSTFVYLKFGMKSACPATAARAATLYSPLTSHHREEGRAGSQGLEGVPACTEDSHFPQHGHVSDVARLTLPRRAGLTHCALATASRSPKAAITSASRSDNMYPSVLRLMARRSCVATLPLPATTTSGISTSSLRCASSLLYSCPSRSARVSTRFVEL